MGDRGNIVVIQEGGAEGAIYLYTHWGGSKLPATLANALERGASRWGDEPYLGRIIFDTLIGDNRSTTGFGISTVLTDNEYPLLVVDDSRCQVRVVPEGAAPADPAAATRTFSYEEFVLQRPDWDGLRGEEP